MPPVRRPQRVIIRALEPAGSTANMLGAASCTRSPQPISLTPAAEGRCQHLRVHSARRMVIASFGAHLKTFYGRTSLPGTEKFVLNLGGESVHVKSIEGGAAACVVVAAAPAAGSFFREKHLSGVRYEPIAITVSTRLTARPLFEWITTAWRGTLARKNGAVLRADSNGTPKIKREFVNAVLFETTVPTLDSASSSFADFTVCLAPEATKDVAPLMSVPPPPIGDDPFLSSNFRLDIADLDCGHLFKIDSFTVRRLPDSGILEFPNLRVEVGGRSAASWRTWFQSVVDNPTSAHNEKAGSLSILNHNLTSVLAQINFFNLGIFRLENAPGSLSHVVADLYCERMDLAIG
jgi:T4-like virus tail tube protein gp19